MPSSAPLPCAPTAAAPLPCAPHFLQAPWLCLMESDFAFIRPLQAPGPAESGVTSLAFEYQYIAPTAPGLQARRSRVPLWSSVSSGGVARAVLLHPLARCPFETLLAADRPPRAALPSRLAPPLEILIKSLFLEFTP